MLLDLHPLTSRLQVHGCRDLNVWMLLTLQKCYPSEGMRDGLAVYLVHLSSNVWEYASLVCDLCRWNPVPVTHRWCFIMQAFKRELCRYFISSMGQGITLTAWQQSRPVCSKLPHSHNTCGPSSTSSTLYRILHHISCFSGWCRLTKYVLPFSTSSTLYCDASYVIWPNMSNIARVYTLLARCSKGVFILITGDTWKSRHCIMKMTWHHPLTKSEQHFLKNLLFSSSSLHSSHLPLYEKEAACTDEQIDALDN